MDYTNNLPFVLTPKDVGKMLGISRNKAYQVFHSEGFPGFTIGNRCRVRSDKFVAWLDSGIGKKLVESL